MRVGVCMYARGRVHACARACAHPSPEDADALRPLGRGLLGGDLLAALLGGLLRALLAALGGRRRVLLAELRSRTHGASGFVWWYGALVLCVRGEVRSERLSSNASRRRHAEKGRRHVEDTQRRAREEHEEAWRRSRVMRGRKVRSSVHKGARRSRRRYTDGRTRQRHADARGRRSIGVQGRRRRERRRPGCRCRFSRIAEAHQHERRHVGGGDRAAQHTGAHDRLEGGGQRHAHEQNEGAQHGESRKDGKCREIGATP